MGIPVDTQPSIKDSEGNETLTLPNSAGTYTLQLQGRNIRGVVVYSNLLILEVSPVKTVITSNMDSDNLKDDSAKDSLDTPVVIVKEKGKKPLPNKNESQLTKKNLELLQRRTEIDRGLRGHILEWIDMMNSLDNNITTKERLKNYDKEYSVELEQIFQEMGHDPEYIEEKEKIYELNKKELFNLIGYLTAEKEKVLSTKFLTDDNLFYIKNLILLYRETKKRLIYIDDSN